MKNTKVNIDKLNDELFVMLHDNQELLDEFLRDDGYDPIQLEKNAIDKIRKMLFKQKVLFKKTQQINLYEKALKIFESAQVTTKTAIVELLRESAPRLQFNNIEKLNEEDLRQILNETELLDIMEKIRKGGVS